MYRQKQVQDPNSLFNFFKPKSIFNNAAQKQAVVNPNNSAYFKINPPSASFQINPPSDSFLNNSPSLVSNTIFKMPSKDFFGTSLNSNSSTASTGNNLFTTSSNSAISELKCVYCRQPTNHFLLVCERCTSQREKMNSEKHKQYLLNKWLGKDGHAETQKLKKQVQEMKQEIQCLQRENGKLVSRLEHYLEKDQQLQQLSRQLQKAKDDQAALKQAFSDAYKQLYLIDDRNQLFWNPVFNKYQRVKKYKDAVEQEIPDHASQVKNFLNRFELNLITTVHQELRTLPNRIKQILQKVETQVAKQKCLTEQTQQKVKEVMLAQAHQFETNSFTMPAEWTAKMLEPLQASSRRADEALARITSLKAKALCLYQQERDSYEQDVSEAEQGEIDAILPVRLTQVDQNLDYMDREIIEPEESCQDQQLIGSSKIAEI